MKGLTEYITEYVSSGRKRNMSPSISDLKIGDMVRIKPKKDILDKTTIYKGPDFTERRYYYDKDSYFYIADKMLDMCGDVCEITHMSLNAVKLYDKKFPSRHFWWALELLEEI